MQTFRWYESMLTKSCQAFSIGCLSCHLWPSFCGHDLKPHFLHHISSHQRDYLHQLQTIYQFTLSKTPSCASLPISMQLRYVQSLIQTFLHPASYCSCILPTLIWQGSFCKEGKARACSLQVNLVLNACFADASRVHLVFSFLFIPFIPMLFHMIWSRRIKHNRKWHQGQPYDLISKFSSPNFLQQEANRQVSVQIGADLTPEVRLFLPEISLSITSATIAGRCDSKSHFFFPLPKSLSLTCHFDSQFPVLRLIKLHLSSCCQGTNLRINGKISFSCKQNSYLSHSRSVSASAVSWFCIFVLYFVRYLYMLSSYALGRTRCFSHVCHCRSLLWSLLLRLIPLLRMDIITMAPRWNGWISLRWIIRLWLMFMIWYDLLPSSS